MGVVHVVGTLCGARYHKAGAMGQVPLCGGCHEGVLWGGSTDSHHASLGDPERREQRPISQLQYEKPQGRTLIGLVSVT